MSKDSEGKLTCKPIRSKIVSLFAEQNDLMYAVPGGLIGVGTKVSIIFVGNSVADRHFDNLTNTRLLVIKIISLNL